MDDRAGFSISNPSYRNTNANDVVQSGIPRWIILAGCLGVLVCLFLWIIAVGVWVYMLRNGNAFENTPDGALPSLTPPPDMGNAGPRRIPMNGRFVVAEGGFSYVPPEGWMAYQVPGFKYPIVSASSKVRDDSNINAGDDDTPGALADYVQITIINLRFFLEEFRLVKREEFRTSDGLLGARMVVEVKQNGRNQRQTFYFFEKGDKKYFAVCATTSEGGEKLDPVFEVSMKTFRIER